MNGTLRLGAEAVVETIAGDELRDGAVGRCAAGSGNFAAVEAEGGEVRELGGGAEVPAEARLARGGGGRVSGAKIAGVDEGGRHEQLHGKERDSRRNSVPDIFHIIIEFIFRYLDFSQKIKHVFICLVKYKKGQYHLF